MDETSDGELPATLTDRVSSRAALGVRRRVAEATLVFLVAICAFVPALPNAALGDDTALLERRLAAVSGLAHLPVVFAEGYWGDLHAGGLYRPLALALLGAQRLAFGTDLAAFRLVSLGLHGLCTLLVLSVLRGLVGRGAIVGALIFAVHPIHAEAVTTIYGQQDVWAASFFVVAVVAYGQWLGDRAKRWWLAVVYLGYLFSLLCKEQGVLLPLLLVFLRRERERVDPSATRRPWVNGAEALTIVPLGCYLAVRLFVLGFPAIPSGEASVAFGYPWWARVNLAIVTLGTYLRLLSWPSVQTTYYGHLRDAIFGWPAAELAWLAGAVIALNGLHGRWERAPVGLATVILIVTLLPVANIVPVGMVVGERVLYLPSVGVAVLVSGAHAWLVARRPRTVRVAAIALVMVGLAASWRTALQWRTPLSHWQATVAAHPASPGAQAAFALSLLDAVAKGPFPAGRHDSRLDRAEEAIDRALALNPNMPDAWRAKGVLALLHRDCAEAIPALRRAVALRPGDRESTELLRRCP